MNKATIFMDFFLSHKLLNSLPSLLFLLIHFLSHQLPSAAYTLPDEYFINCGSETNVTDTRRIFAGDVNPMNQDSFSFSRPTSAIHSNQPTSTPLYQTARLFRKPSSYEFQISRNGTYLVRLHFFAFASQDDLKSAFFDVLASGIPLLNNFTAINTGTQVIREFIFSISAGKFVLHFVPQGSSFAFINAIEVFPAPDSFVPDVAPHVSPVGSDKDYEGILSKALHTIYRINVGGPLITPENDTLWRYWVADDTYLYNPNTARNSTFYPNKPYYQQQDGEYIAPDFVYRTGKEMNIDTGRVSNMFNITWSLIVRKNFRYLVRAHFCNIVSQTFDDFSFNLYIYGNFGIEIKPYERVGHLAAAFYDDLVVDSDDSGLMNVSIGPHRGSQAFLNGLEILEMVGELGLIARKNVHKKTPTFLVAGSVLAGVCILAAVLWLGLRCKKTETNQTMANYRPERREGTINGSHIPHINLGLSISFAEIQLATNNFDEKLRIGKGGFGIVFRGTLRNGMKVAVKRSNPNSGQGFQEFRAEITVLSQIRHRHLVSMLGYCEERSEMILVYEYMEKGSLRDHLYDSTFPSLSWNQRLEICIGAAKGIHYLHRGPSGGFIHRDVKSTNILLDENYVAKVADFGLSRLFPSDQNQTHVTTSVKGTFGYLDPDYFRTQRLTDKSDVYSLGIVLLEVLCARPAINTSLPLEEVNLAEWALFCKAKGTLDQIVDPSIKCQINPSSLTKFWETVEKCLQEFGEDRPSMADVVWDLEYALQLQQTARLGEAYEDSISDASAVLAVPNFGRLPSLSSSVERDDMPILSEDTNSIVLVCQIFSQLRMDDPR